MKEFYTIFSAPCGCGGYGNYNNGSCNGGYNCGCGNNGANNGGCGCSSAQRTVYITTLTGITGATGATGATEQVL